MLRFRLRQSEPPKNKCISPRIHWPIPPAGVVSVFHAAADSSALSHCVFEAGSLGVSARIDNVIEINTCTVSMDHCRIINYVSWGRPVVRVYEHGQLMMENCEIADIDNVTGGCGGGLRIDSHGQVTMRYSRIQDCASLDGESNLHAQ